MPKKLSKPVGILEQGKVTTLIRCGYFRGTPHPTSFTQDWSMEREGLGMVVSVNYRHGLLPQWQDIQTKVSQFVLDFKDPTATAIPRAADAQR